LLAWLGFIYNVDIFSVISFLSTEAEAAMKKAKLRKKLTAHRRIMCHWCQLVLKEKPADAVQHLFIHRR